MFLSGVIGKIVVDARGEDIGRVKDLVASPGPQFPPITAVVVSRGKDEEIVVSWRQVRSIEDELELAVSEEQLQKHTIREGDLLLNKDVMDKQIVDVHDYRVVRVNDVRLAMAESGPFLVGVDTGMRGLLRRLGIEHIIAPIMRKLNRKLSGRIIPWEDVETFERSGGKLKLKVAAERLSKLHPADIAKIINEMDPRQRAEVLGSLDLETAAEALAEADPDVQVSILEEMEDERAADILEEMEPDEAADVLGDMSAERREEIMEEMEDEEAEDVQELLAYDDATAGGMMTTEYIAIEEDLNANQTIEHLRKNAPDAETIYYVYVIDRDERLVGVISLRELIVAHPDTPVSEFMVTKIIYVRLDTPTEEVVQIMGDYNLLALPVVDDENKLQGIVTVDDALQHVLPEDWRRRVPKIWSS